MTNKHPWIGCKTRDGKHIVAKVEPEDGKVYCWMVTFTNGRNEEYTEAGRYWGGYKEDPLDIMIAESHPWIGCKTLDGSLTVVKVEPIGNAQYPWFVTFDDASHFSYTDRGRFFVSYSNHPFDIMINDPRQDDPTAMPVASVDAPIDFTKPVMTRDGRAVTIRFTDGPGLFCVLGYIEDSERPEAWTLVGRYTSTGKHSNDLVNVLPKNEYFLNVYSDCMGRAYTSLDTARDSAKHDVCIGMVKITTCGDKITAEVL